MYMPFAKLYESDTANVDPNSSFGSYCTSYSIMMETRGLEADSSIRRNFVFGPIVQLSHSKLSWGCHLLLYELYPTSENGINVTLYNRKFYMEH